MSVVRQKKTLVKEALEPKQKPDKKPKTDLTQLYSFENVRDKWRDLCSYWRWYPDKFLDFIRPPDSNIHLYFYQRIYLRIFLRFRKVFLTATRGTSKSYLQNLAFILICIFYPGEKLFICCDIKEQAAKISQQAIDSIFEHYPLLRDEVKFYTANNDYTRLVFWHGSQYDVVQMTDATRGGRRMGGAVDEIASEKFDGDKLHEIVIPLMANNRMARCGKVDKEEVHKREIYITTSKHQQTFGYSKLMEVVDEMENGQSAFYMGNSYELPCMHSQLDIDFVEGLKTAPTFSIMSFMQEYESIWTGSSTDNIVSDEKLRRARVVKVAEWEHCNESNVSYILCYDVARAEGQENANSALIVIKLTLKDDGTFKREVVNIFSMEGTHFKNQATFVKRQVDAFRPIAVVVDANGLGAGLVDFLVLDLDDGFPPYNVVNDDRYDKFRTANGVNILYAIKSQQKETKDSMMIDHFYALFDKIAVGLLILPNEGIKELRRKLKLKDDDSERDANLMLPYIMTDLLCEEIMNIRRISEGHDAREERISKKIQRDKYSALKYGLWIAYQKEQENQIRRSEQDLTRFGVFARSGNARTPFDRRAGVPFARR